MINMCSYYDYCYFYVVAVTALSRLTRELELHLTVRVLIKLYRYNLPQSSQVMTLLQVKMFAILKKQQNRSQNKK